MDRQLLSLNIVTDCCLYQYDIPAELRFIIQQYLCILIPDNASFRNAVKLWLAPQTMEETAFKYGNISYWDVSQITDMARLFAGCSGFNDPVVCWDVSNVKTMNDMFLNAKTFNQPLNRWNTSSVIEMKSMFQYYFV